MRTLERLQSDLENLRQERLNTLNQLPALEYMQFCKLPTNRKPVSCSRQKLTELVKRMEQLIDEEKAALVAIWDYTGENHA